MNLFRRSISFLLASLISVFCVAQSAYINYFKGIASLEKGDHQQAIAHFNTSLQQQEVPEQKILEFRGRAYLALNKASLAKADFEALTMQDQSKGHYGLAMFYANQKNENKAVGQLKLYLGEHHKIQKSEIKLDTCFRNINSSKEWEDLWKEDWYSKQELSLADAKYYFETDDNSMAFDVLDEMLQKKNRKHKAYFLRSKVNFSEGEISAAIKDINQAIKIKNKNADYYAFRAQIYFHNNKLKAALNDIEKAIDLDPLVRSYYLTRAELLFKLKETKNALNRINDYLLCFPDELEAKYIAGKCYYDLNNLTASHTLFTECIEADNGQTRFWMARGNTNQAMKKNQEAINDYSMSLDLNPKQATVYYSRAFSYQELNEQERACSDFKKAFSLGFKDALIHVQEFCGKTN